MGGAGFRDYLNGYIIVKAEGLNPEKFINMSARYGINLWDIERVSFTTIEFKMKHSQYVQLKKIIHKTGSKTKIKKKHGLNFLLKKANKRKFFLIGIMVFLGILLYLSSLVWKIEIYGNKKVDKNRVYESVQKFGLMEGKIKYSLNLREIEVAVLKDIKEISIVNISFNGTKARVEIVERTMPPGILKTDTPSNIIAVKEGIITKVLAYKGQPLVKAGDYVKKDEVLISGVITDVENNPHGMVNSMGEVYAKTWYEGREEVNLNYRIETRTNNVRKKEYLIIGGRKVYTKNDTIDFKIYDKIEEKNNVKLSNFVTPIEKVTEYYYEKSVTYKKLTLDEAYSRAVKAIEDRLNEEMPKNIKILDKKLDKNFENGIAKVRLLYIAEEKIGVQQPIH